MNTFAPLLTRYRQHAGLGLNELARAARCDPSHVSSLESGRRVPSRGMVVALAGALALDEGDADRLLTAAGYAPEWMQALAGVARISPREVARVAS